MKTLLVLILVLGSFGAWAQDTTEEELLQELDGGFPGGQPPPPEIMPEAPRKAPAPPAQKPGTSVMKLEREAAPPPPPAVEPPPPEVSSEGLEAPAMAEGPAESAGGSDARVEARFARIYENFNRTEITDGEWSKIAGDRAAESYMLQNGDTLWDISEKFFGNGFYWPKVWQLNDAITNPHMVQEGYSLRFSPGSTTAAPQLAVQQDQAQQLVDEEPEPEVESEVTADSGSAVTQEVYIPPGRRGGPVMTKIPPSFVDSGFSQGRYDANGFAIEVSRDKQPAKTRGWVGTLISDSAWDGTGEIIEMEGGMTVASTNQYIVIKLDGPVQPGMIYTVFKNRGKVSDLVGGGTAGVAVETRGRVQITGAFEGAENTYRALVLSCTNPINLGDEVVAGDYVSPIDFAVSGPRSLVAARIVDGEFENRQMFSLHDVVYLNRGSEDGLQVGNLLDVIKNIRLRNSSSAVRYDPAPIGILKVVSIGKRVATAVIVAERDAIYPGDETAVTGPVLEPNPESGTSAPSSGP